MPRILIVEDDPGVARVLERAALAAGFEVGFARAAPDALAEMARQPADAVVLDIGLPGNRDGRDVLRALGAAGAAVWLYSGQDDPFTRSLCAEYGARGFFSKGVGAAEVVREIARDLGTAAPNDGRRGGFPPGVGQGFQPRTR